MIAAAGLFAAFGPMYVPILLIALWCCHGRPGPTVATTFRRNRVLVVASLVGLGVAAVTYSIPVWLVAARHYSNLSSPLAFRSGLDGDTTYFQDAVQAVLHPYPSSLVDVVRLGRFCVPHSCPCCCASC